MGRNTDTKTTQIGDDQVKKRTSKSSTRGSANKRRPTTTPPLTRSTPTSETTKTTAMAWEKGEERRPVEKHGGQLQPQHRQQQERLGRKEEKQMRNTRRYLWKTRGANHVKNHRSPARKAALHDQHYLNNHELEHGGDCKHNQCEARLRPLARSLQHPRLLHRHLLSYYHPNHHRKGDTTRVQPTFDDTARAHIPSRSAATAKENQEGGMGGGFGGKVGGYKVYKANEDPKAQDAVRRRTRTTT